MPLQCQVTAHLWILALLGLVEVRGTSSQRDGAEHLFLGATPGTWRQSLVFTSVNLTPTPRPAVHGSPKAVSVTPWKSHFHGDTSTLRGKGRLQYNPVFTSGKEFSPSGETQTPWCPVSSTFLPQIFPKFCPTAQENGRGAWRRGRTQAPRAPPAGSRAVTQAPKRRRLS